MELQQSDSSHFRTIQRQDSFDMSNEPANNCSRVGQVTVVRPQPRTQSLDLSNYALQTLPLNFDEHLTRSPLSDLSKSATATEKDDSKVLAHEDGTVHTGPAVGMRDAAEGQNDNNSQPTKHTLVETNIADDGIVACAESSTMMQTENREQDCTGSAPVSEGDSGIDPSVEGGEEEMAELAAPKDEARHNGVSWRADEELGNCADISTKQEQQDKKKGERQTFVCFCSSQIQSSSQDLITMGCVLTYSCFCRQT